MENYVVSLFVTLFICVFDGYCMMNYRLSAKKQTKRILRRFSYKCRGFKICRACKR